MLRTATGALSARVSSARTGTSYQRRLGARTQVPVACSTSPGIATPTPWRRERRSFASRSADVTREGTVRIACPGWPRKERLIVIARMPPRASATATAVCRTPKWIPTKAAAASFSSSRRERRPFREGETPKPTSRTSPSTSNMSTIAETVGLVRAERRARSVRDTVWVCRIMSRRSARFISRIVRLSTLASTMGEL